MTSDGPFIETKVEINNKELVVTVRTDYEGDKKCIKNIEEYLNKRNQWLEHCPCCSIIHDEFPMKGCDCTYCNHLVEINLEGYTQGLDL